MHYWIDGGNVIWMALCWIAGVALFVALLLFLLSAARALSRNNHSPEAILKRRYAAGAIDTEEYERRLAELSKTRSAA
jgi:uncharacterized membrane protein